MFYQRLSLQDVSVSLLKGSESQFLHFVKALKPGVRISCASKNEYNSVTLSKCIEYGLFLAKMNEYVQVGMSIQFYSKNNTIQR